MCRKNGCTDMIGCLMGPEIFNDIIVIDKNRNQKHNFNFCHIVKIMYLYIILLCFRGYGLMLSCVVIFRVDF